VTIDNCDANSSYLLTAWKIRGEMRLHAGYSLSTNDERAGKKSDFRVCCLQTFGGVFFEIEKVGLVSWVIALNRCYFKECCRVLFLSATQLAMTPVIFWLRVSGVVTYVVCRFLTSSSSRFACLSTSNSSSSCP